MKVSGVLLLINLRTTVLPSLGSVAAFDGVVTFDVSIDLRFRLIRWSRICSAVRSFESSVVFVLLASPAPVIRFAGVVDGRDRNEACDWATSASRSNLRLNFINELTFWMQNREENLVHAAKAHQVFNSYFSPKYLISQSSNLVSSTHSSLIVGSTLSHVSSRFRFRKPVRTDVTSVWQQKCSNLMTFCKNRWRKRGTQITSNKTHFKLRKRKNEER